MATRISHPAPVHLDLAGTFLRAVSWMVFIVIAMLTIVPLAMGEEMNIGLVCGGLVLMVVLTAIDLLRRRSPVR